MFVLYFTGILFVLASVGYADEANLNPECLVPPATDVVCGLKIKLCS